MCVALAAAWKDRDVELLRQLICLIEEKCSPSFAFISNDAFENMPVPIEADHPMLQHLVPTPIPTLPKHNSIKPNGFFRNYVHDPRLSHMPPHKIVCEFRAS